MTHTKKQQRDISSKVMDDPRYIEAQIEQTRLKMDVVIDELFNRIDVRRAIHNLLDSFRNLRSSSSQHAVQESNVAGQRLFDPILEHKIPVLLAGAAAVWWFFEDQFSKREPASMAPNSSRSASSSSLSEKPQSSASTPKTSTLHHSQETTTMMREPNINVSESAGLGAQSFSEPESELGSRVKDAVNRAGHNVSRWSHEQLEKFRQFGHSATHPSTGSSAQALHEHLTDTGEQIGQNLEEAIDVSRRRLNRSIHRVSDLIAEYPWSVGIGAMVLGVVIGRAISMSQRSSKSGKFDSSLDPSVERIGQQAREKGQEFCHCGQHSSERSHEQIEEEMGRSPF